MLSRVVFFILMTYSLWSVAQDISCGDSRIFFDDIKEIDSLINISRFQQAENKIDYWSDCLENSNRSKKQLVELKFRRALLLDRQNKPPTQVIKVLQEILEKSKTEKLHSLSCRIELLMALCYEKAENLELTNTYLQTAYNTYKKHHLESLYSTYCLRKSSYFRFKGELDSTLHYAKRANYFALQHGNERDQIDSHILLSAVAKKKKKYSEALKHQFKLLDVNKKRGDSLLISVAFSNIAQTYLTLKDTQKAIIYSDSARFSQVNNISSNYSISEIRYKAFELNGNIDSAYANLKRYNQEYKLWGHENEKSKTKELEEHYQNDKKETIIKNKNEQIVWIIGLLTIISVAAILIARKNRVINHKNKTINQQLEILSKTLEQKQILLSELQHRVKNNLQHVISILEMQKESVGFNNIHELIRSNQNRIHSMALLHKKLNISENVQEINLKRYLTELSVLVKESYDHGKKEIDLDITCEIDIFSLEKALPIGLIIVELISNSMKHAFKNCDKGRISIQFNKEDNNALKLSYSDTGSGFDFSEEVNQGLGLEIIRGLIDQLDGTISTSYNDGFELSIYFK